MNQEHQNQRFLGLLGKSFVIITAFAATSLVLTLPGVTYMALGGSLDAGLVICFCLGFFVGPKLLNYLLKI